MKNHFHVTLTSLLQSPLAMLVLLVICSVSPATHADETSANMDVTTRYIIPAYERLTVSTNNLDQQAKTFCAEPSDNAFKQLQSGFHTAMDDWQYIQHIRFGPVQFLLRLNRFQLWPDKRSSVSKHLARLLDSQDSSSLEPKKFPRGSVAVQGFSALERLLFDGELGVKDFQSHSTTSQFHCTVIKTITHNLSTMSSGIVEQWTKGDSAYTVFIATAQEGNDFYESANDVSSDMLNNLYTQLQAIVDQKLERPLGTNIDQAQGRRAESWRSNRSLRNIEINLKSTEDFYLAAFSPRVADHNLDTKIRDGFTDAQAAVKKISQPLDKAVSDPLARNLVMASLESIRQLKSLVGGSLPSELGLPLGFNSLDGD